MLPQKQFHQSLFSGCIGLIPHRQIRPVRFIHDTFEMRKGLKTGLSMIAAHTAFPEAAKAHIRCGQVNDGVVHTAAAKGTAGQNPVSRSMVPGEEVERQRVGPLVDGADHFFDGAVGENRQNGAEDLLLHDVVPPGDPIEKGRLDF